MKKIVINIFLSALSLAAIAQHVTDVDNDNGAVHEQVEFVPDTIIVSEPDELIFTPSDTLIHISQPDTLIYTVTEIQDSLVHDNIIVMSDSIDWFSTLPVESLEDYYKHSPAKAAMMSAVLPGLGQAYNRKYWKIPIVYLALGISIERFVYFQNYYNKYRRAYITFNDGDPYTNFHDTIFPEFFTDTQISHHINRSKDRFRTWRDYAVVAVVLSYMMNIIDANVDAHLMDFSLDDNISLKISPVFFDNVLISQKLGLSLRVFF